MATATTTQEKYRTASATPDYRKTASRQIAELVTEGNAPWQRSYAAGELAMPINPVSGKEFKGGNAVYLMATAAERGYKDPRWVTFDQAAKMGGNVNGGERGTQIEFWTVKEGKSHQTIYSVFNAEQVAGLPPYSRAPVLPNVRINHGEISTQLGKAAVVSGHSPVQADLRVKIARLFAAAQTGTAHVPENQMVSPATTIGALYNDRNEIYRAANDASRAVELATERSMLARVSVSPTAMASLPAVIDPLGKPTDGRIPVLALDYQGANYKILTADVRKEWVGNPDPISLGSNEQAYKELHRIARMRREQKEVTRETTDQVTRFEPGTNTVDARSKTTGKEERIPVAIPAGNPDISKAAAVIVKEAMAEGAQIVHAQRQSGTYRGEVIGETPTEVIQKVSATFAVAHQKTALDKYPTSGPHYIAYAGGRGQVRESRAVNKEREMSIAG